MEVKTMLKERKEEIIKAYANEKKKEAIEIIETTDNGGEILSASKYNG